MQKKAKKLPLSRSTAKSFVLVLPASACRSRSDLRSTLRLHAHTSDQGYQKLSDIKHDINLGGISKYEFRVGKVVSVVCVRRNRCRH